MNKKRLTDFVNRREERFSGGEPHAAAFHSRSYHRYFEGWSEQRRVGPDGRTRIERVYVGAWYIQALSVRAQALLRGAYVLGWLGAAALYGYGATRPVGSNSAWYVALFEAGSAAGLFWLLVALVHCLAAPRRRTVHGYRASSLSLRRAAAFSAAALALAAAATALWLLPRGEAAAWISAGTLLLSAAVCFGLNRAERRVPYRTEQSEHAAPPDGSVIE